ncbi:MAG: hypothetical protein K0S92_139, partial [Desertimonas sp.]|nr:hypothetical protein [Desertimonas sp.]
DVAEAAESLTICVFLPLPPSAPPWRH